MSKLDENRGQGKSIRLRKCNVRFVTILGLEVACFDSAGLGPATLQTSQRVLLHNKETSHFHYSYTEDVVFILNSDGKQIAEACGT